jgi:two-component system sensor kinase FixL
VIDEDDGGVEHPVRAERLRGGRHRGQHTIHGGRLPAAAIHGARRWAHDAPRRLGAPLGAADRDRNQWQESQCDSPIRNAAEAICDSGRPGEVTVEVRPEPAGDAGLLEIAVRDNGPGVARTVAERMFEPFFTTRPRGLGMGLAISRSIVEAHGGRLWAELGPEHGLVVRFTVPRWQPPAS